MVGSETGKDRLVVALKVWEMAAVLVNPFHASRDIMRSCTRGDARAYIFLFVVPEWEGSLHQVPGLAVGVEFVPMWDGH